MKILPFFLLGLFVVLVFTTIASQVLPTAKQIEPAAKVLLHSY